MTDHSKKRTYLRVPLDLVGSLRRIEHDDFGAPQESATANLSRGGLFIEMADPFEIGSVLAFEITLPGDSEGTAIVGAVRWRSETSPRGVGVEIILAEHPENRKYPRLPAKLLTFIRKASEEGMDLPAWASGTNVSPDGIYIETDETFDVGSFVEFEVGLPGQSEAPPMLGVVRWRSHIGPKGVGLQIVLGDRSRLEDFLKDDMLYRCLLEMFPAGTRHFVSRALPSSDAN